MLKECFLTPAILQTKQEKQKKSIHLETPGMGEKRNRMERIEKGSQDTVIVTRGRGEGRGRGGAGL